MNQVGLWLYYGWVWRQWDMVLQIWLEDQMVDQPWRIHAWPEGFLWGQQGWQQWKLVLEDEQSFCSTVVQGGSWSADLSEALEDVQEDSQELTSSWQRLVGLQKCPSLATREAFKEILIVWSLFSMAPLVAAWWAGVKRTSTLKVFMMSLYKFEIKEFPLS